VLAWVNAEEHLRLMVEFKGCDVSETFCAFATVYEMLRWRLKQNGEEYAHDAMFGWVGYDPHQIGTCFEGALRIRLDYNEDKATAETVGDEQADREEETRESILKEFDLKLSSPLTSNAAGSDENSRYEVKETWYMLRTHLRIGKRDERIGKRDAKGVSAMARDDASIISELMLIQDLVHGGAKRLLALDQRLISTAKERNEELQRKACEAKQLREEREAVYHVGLDLLGWPTPKLNGSGNKIPPQEIYTTRLLESGEVIRGCVRLHREDVTESLLIVPKPKFVASDAENVTKTIALYANLALHFDRMQRLQVEGGVHTRINLDSAEAKFVSSRVLLRLQDPSAVFDSILSSTGATDTRTISEIGDYLITQRMMDALKELRDFESSKGKGSSKSAEERGLNTEMVQEQEQQQQVEKVEQQTEFGDFDDYIIREQLRWCPIFVLRASKRETLLREKLLPFETLKMKGETAHEGVLWPEKNAQEMSLLFSPNWAAREYRGSRTRRVRNIEVLVRVIHSPTSSSLVLVTLEEAEGIMRALDALSERAPRTSLDALSERAPRTSNARAAATKQGSDPIIEMYSLQGVLLSRHGTSGGSTEEQEEQKVPKEQKDEAVTVDLGNRLISEQYLLDNLDKDDESQDPERLLMHFGSMREKTSAKERFLLTATFVRLRFWNSEFIFASSELLALLASLKSLGFTASDVAKVFWELHKGRRRDTSQADILNTDLHALLGNKATEWDVLCELENANKKEENLGSKQSTLEERIKEVRKDDATASASRKPVVREARMRGERSAVERADSSVLTPATAEATPAGLSAHLIAVTPETAGELSMVAGTQLELYASNLLWTRSGSFVTVCPRGCLLRPSSGRWYMELNVHRTSASGGTIFGVVTERFNSASKAVGADEFSWGVGEKGLRHANQNTPISSGDLWQDGDVVGCLIDCKQAELRFYRNGLELQGGVASFLDVRGQIGLCPALTIDCGFLGFFNLGESPFRYPPNMAGVKAVYAFVLEQRTLQHLRMSNAPGKMRALFNRRAVKIEPSGNEWSLKRVPNCWRDPTVSLDGVLLTHGKWFFEVDLGTNPFGYMQIGCHDTLFKPASGDQGLGDDKHSWALEVGGFRRRTGLLRHAGKRVKWDDKFKGLSTGLIGCAIDVDRGTIRYVIKDKNGELYVNVAYEGVAFAGGLIPSLTLYCYQPIVRLYDCELLQAAKLPPELAEYRPIGNLLAITKGASVATPMLETSIDRMTKRLLPTSGHNTLFFDDTYKVHCTAFLGSLTAPGLTAYPPSQVPRKLYYEVKIERLGGAGTASDVFDLEAREYVESDDKPGQKVVQEGGPAAFGWATSRFRGDYSQMVGVGDERISWGFAGANLDKDGGKAAKGGDEGEADDRLHQYALFKSADASPSPPIPWHEDNAKWATGGVVGCAITIQPDATGHLDYYYNGKMVHTTRIRDNLLLNGVMPAISLHANMCVTVNFGDGGKFNHAPSGFNPVLSAAASVDAPRSAATPREARRNHKTRSDVLAAAGELTKQSREEGGRLELARSAMEEAKHTGVLWAEGKPTELGEALYRPFITGCSLLNLSELNLSEPLTIAAIFDVLEGQPPAVVEGRPPAVVVSSIVCKRSLLRAVSIETLAQRIESQTQLERLDLSNNTLGAEGIATLAVALRSMNNHALEELDVSDNNVGNEGIAALCSNISAPTVNGPTGLRVLRLARNSISATGVQAIGNALARLPLEELYLDKNGLGPGGAEHLADALSSNSHLRVLSLSETGLRTKGVTSLAEALSHNDTLTRLVLGHGNSIDAEGLGALAEVLKKNENSSLSSLVVHEDAVDLHTRAKLLFSLKAAVTAAKEEAECLLDFGSLLLVDGQTHCKRFFRGPLSFCVRSLMPVQKDDTKDDDRRCDKVQQKAAEKAAKEAVHEAQDERGAKEAWRRELARPRYELAGLLIDDRNAYGSAEKARGVRGRKSYVSDQDAQCALLEVVLLPDVETANLSTLERMVGSGAGFGMRSVTLRAQQGRLANLDTAEKKTKLAEASEPHQAKLEADLHAPEADVKAAQDSSWWGDSRFLPSINHPDQPSQKARPDPAAFLYSADNKLRHVTLNVTLREDLWSAALPVPNTQLYKDLLSTFAWNAVAPPIVGTGSAQPDGQPTVPNRTVLLAALHEGHQTAALVLARRLNAGPSFEIDAAGKLGTDGEGAMAFSMTLNAAACDELAKGGLHVPPVDTKLTVPEWPDAVGLSAVEGAFDKGGVADRAGAAEALRVAAVRGMPSVVTALLAYRKLALGTTANQPCHKIAGTCGMLTSLRDREGRTLLHDVCRTLLPRGDGIEYAQASSQMVEMTKQVLALKSANGEAVGWGLLHEADNHGRLPLHYAAAFGHVGMLRLEGFLTGNGHEHSESDLLNATDEQGWTPLALAVSNGHLRVAELLVEYGAFPVPIIKDEKRVPCAFVLALLRHHYERVVRPNLSSGALKKADARPAAVSSKEASDPAAVEVHARRLGWLRQRVGARVHGSRSGGQQSSLIESLSEKSKRNAGRALLLAERFLGLMNEQDSTMRYRRSFLWAHEARQAFGFLIYLILLTAVALHTTGVGSWPGRASGSGLSMSFLLQNEVGGLVSGEEFSGINEGARLNGFLDPNGGPLFAGLLEGVDVDPNTQLLGAVRLRLVRSGPAACHDGWLAADGACADDDWYLYAVFEIMRKWFVGGSAPSSLASFAGPASGREYTHCEDGVFCNASGHAARHLFGYWPGDRWFLGTAGYVLDLHPSRTNESAAALQAVIDDGVLEDGLTRALFIDYTLYNRPLSAAVVVHLTVEMPPSGTMIPRAMKVLLPLYWPLYLGERIMVGCEATVVAWTLAQATFELSEACKAGVAVGYFSTVWNFLDVIGLSLLLVWIAARTLWWHALVSWHGLDLQTAAYVGCFQPLSTLILVQRAMLALGLFFQWLRLLGRSENIPKLGPLLHAFFTTLFSFKVLVFIAVTWFFACILGVGTHVAFGNEVQQFDELGSAILASYAAIFGNMDQNVLVEASGGLGALFWIILILFGVALLSNIFIAIISEEYNVHIEECQEKWKERVTHSMQSALWEQITMNKAWRKEPNKNETLFNEIRRVLDQGRDRARRHFQLGDLFRGLGELLAKARVPCCISASGSGWKRWIRRGPLRKAWLGFFLREPFFWEVTGDAEDVDALVEKYTTTVAVHSKGEAGGGNGGGVLWYAHKRDDKGNDWYDDKAIRERFHFSWVALRRWEENEVKIELETEQQLLQRRKEKMMEQMLSQTTATVEQIRFLSEGRSLG